MKYYLLEPFAKDLSIEKNPPLSEKGIRMARVFALTMKGISIDYCYTDTVSDFDHDQHLQYS